MWGTKGDRWAQGPEFHFIFLSRWFYQCHSHWYFSFCIYLFIYSGCVVAGWCTAFVGSGLRAAACCALYPAGQRRSSAAEVCRVGCGKSDDLSHSDPRCSCRLGVPRLDSPLVWQSLEKGHGLQHGLLRELDRLPSATPPVSPVLPWHIRSRKCKALEAIRWLSLIRQGDTAVPRGSQIQPDIFSFMFLTLQLKLGTWSCPYNFLLLAPVSSGNFLF